MEFVQIPAGAFRYGYRPGFNLGDPPDQEDHIVWHSKAYYLQTTEVTQGQWQAVMGTTVPELCRALPYPTACNFATAMGDRYPIHYVTVSQIGEFIQRLSEREKLKYRLPTRPEWEKAALAGQWRVSYWWGNDPDKTVLYENCAVAGDAPPWLPWLPHDGYAGLAPVASFRPNPWGFYDMLGNVAELTIHASTLWSGMIPNPAEQFTNDPSGYIAFYTDFPHEWLPNYHYRYVVGGDYLRQSYHCNFSAGGGRLELEEYESQIATIASSTVGFRLLLEADSLQTKLQPQQP
ncbi:MAG: formylglycine-generating enzyme family protein [Candidatus Sericytochromatia bacterium]